MKSIFSGAVIATAVVACLSLSVQAKPLNHSVTTVAASDTGKMAKDKMKMAKMEKKKMVKMDKMKMDKMKMEKKKMAKDTGKM
ncbi:hypothetical protein BH09BAC6_BH09BAC6_33660 [soil metagenome]|jgi:uncharacterized protein involved in copper resistance